MRNKGYPHSVMNNRSDGRRQQNSRRPDNRRQRSGPPTSGRPGFQRPKPPSAVRKAFEQLTPMHPTERYVLETRPDEKIGRWMDLMTPVGRGQRALIVSPPKSGKTTILKTISRALSANHPDVVQYVLLVDERPEEVTDFQRSVQATVVASSSDKSTESHVEKTRDVLEEAMRHALEGKHAVILLDSITRLARAFNIHIDSHSKTLSGGLGAMAMEEPRRFFGAARNIEHGGSLTVVATALVQTGSRMDDVIFQEFKGTGNMELVLSRDLAEKRQFPAIQIKESGTRKEELLYSETEYRGLVALRQILAQLSPDDAYRMMDKVLGDIPTNREMLLKLSPA